MAKKSSAAKKKGPDVPKVDPYLEGLMGKLVERLESLERKLDTVISQTAAPSGNGHAAASNPPQSRPHPNPPQQSNRPQPQQQQPPRRERQLYEAICADCRKVCEVPFQPAEGRAVYCKECFAVRKGQGRPNQPNGGQKTPVPQPPKPAAPPQAAAPAHAPKTNASPKPPKKAAKKGKRK